MPTPSEEELLRLWRQLAVNDRLLVLDMLRLLVKKAGAVPTAALVKKP